jgi:WD40 repeat protein
MTYKRGDIILGMPMLRFVVPAVLVLSLVFGVAILVGIGVGQVLPTSEFTVFVHPEYMGDDEQNNRTREEIILTDLSVNYVTSLGFSNAAGQISSMPTFSNRRYEIAYISGKSNYEQDIFVINLRTKKSRQITKLNKAVVNSFAWSPDDQRLAVAYDQYYTTSKEARRYIQQEALLIVDVHTTETIHFYEEVREVHGWSDSELLVSVRDFRALLDLSTNKLLKLNFHSDCRFFCTLSPNGDYFAFWKSDGIYITELKNYEVRKLDTQYHDYWSLYQWTRDSKYLLLYDSDGIYSVNIFSAEIVKLGKRLFYRPFRL